MNIVIKILSLFFSFFLELLLSLLSGFIFKCIEKHFRPYFGCSIKKKNTNRAVLMETIKLQAVVIRAKTLIFRFHWCKMNSKLDFREKKTRF